MSDLILGRDWLRPVHALPGRPFGDGPPERSTIAGSLGRMSRAIPHTPFLSQIDGEPRTVTYVQAYRAVHRLAALFAIWRLQRGERIGILGSNSIDFVFAVLAVLEAGGVAVLLDPHDPPARIAAHVEFTQVRFLLHDPGCASLAQYCASCERTCSFHDCTTLAPRAAAGPVARPAPTDGALIFFTSGTTGAPKAVVQSHFAVAQNAWSLAGHHHIGPGVRLLCVLPLHHVNGLEFTIISAMLGGGHTIISRGLDGLRFWKWVREYRIHIASLVPNLLRLLAERPGLRGEGALPLLYVVSAAAPLSSGIARQAWERLGLRIVQGYGLSEATNFSCLLPVALVEHEYRRWMLDGRRTSVGPPLPSQEVQIHNGDAAAPDEAEGEIVIRGHCMMSGYLHNPQATEEAFRGGWFHTGDLGYALLDGEKCRYFHISGRLREIAKRSGATVSLLEVDEVLASLPGVADAGAAAFANTWVDEEICACVVLQAGTTLTEGRVVEQSRRLLSFAATPKMIEFVNEIPRTASGKIRRPQIAERFSPFRDRLFVEERRATDALGKSDIGNKN